MKSICLFIAIVFIVLPCLAQNLKRQKGETAHMFTARLKPDTMALTHPVIETTIWTMPESIVAFYGYDDSKDPNTGFNKIFGHLYIPIGKDFYRDIPFGPIEEDGGYPEIISVFFANADKDKAKELIVLCKYEQRHYDYDGEFYETFIFDNPTEKDSLICLDKLSEKFFGCECGWRDGKTKKAKYKTAAAVKKGLLKMGYK